MGKPLSTDHVNLIGGLTADFVDAVMDKVEEKRTEYIKQAVDEYKKLGGEAKKAFQGLRQGDAMGALKHAGVAWEHGIEGNLNMLGSVGAGALQTFGKLNLQTDTFDLLRLGDSYFERNWKGILKDVLRLFNIIPMIGEAAAVFKEGLFVTQKAGLKNCAMVAINNGLAESGQGLSLKELWRNKKFFISMERIAEQAGIDLAQYFTKGTTAAQSEEIMSALEKMGVALERMPASSALQDLRALEQMARARPNGVFVVSIKYGQVITKPGGIVTRSSGHRLCAQWAEQGLVFLDTNGEVYNGIADLARTYENVMLSPGQTAFLKNTWLVRAFQEIHANLFFPAVFWHRAAKNSPVSAFSGPPRGNSVIDRGPLGFA